MNFSIGNKITCKYFPGDVGNIEDIFRADASDAKLYNVLEGTKLAWVKWELDWGYTALSLKDIEKYKEQNESAD